MLRLTRDDLQHIAPRPKTPKKAAIWDGYVAALTSPEGAALFERYQVNTPLRVQHALAQWAGPETAGFSLVFESGAYSAAGILRVFGYPHHSSPVSEEEAREIAALPVYDDGSGPRADRLFERVYGYLTHIGPTLGNTLPGDGQKYRGLGPDQATGKYAWMHAAQLIGCSLEALAQPINMLHMALIEWSELGCNEYADQDDCVNIRSLINLGHAHGALSKMNGLPAAQATLRLCKNVITEADFSSDGGVNPRVAVGNNGGPPLEPDIPVNGDHLQPTNEFKPASLWQSTEMHQAGAGAITSGGVAGTKIMAFLPAAFGAAHAGGGFSLTDFAFSLLSNADFYEWAFASIAAGGCIYLMVQRYKRFHIWGV
jgi:predicted chitinase